MQRISRRPRACITPQVAAGIALATLGLVSCSDGDDGKRAESNLTASQVCASTLDASAATALERMGDTEKFTELPGTNDSGKPNKFSLKRAADTLHNDMTQRNQCVVFKSGDTTGHPLISVDFSAVKHHPSTTTGDSKGSDPSRYRMGVYAATHGTTGSRCTSSARRRTPMSRGSPRPTSRQSLSDSQTSSRRRAQGATGWPSSTPSHVPWQRSWVAPHRHRCHLKCLQPRPIDTRKVGRPVPTPEPKALVPAIFPQD